MQLIVNLFLISAIQFATSAKETGGKGQPCNPVNKQSKFWQDLCDPKLLCVPSSREKNAPTVCKGMVFNVPIGGECGILELKHCRRGACVNGFCKEITLNEFGETCNTALGIQCKNPYSCSSYGSEGVCGTFNPISLPSLPK
jgi:hypothetical protein